MNHQDAYLLSHATEIAERHIRAARRLQAQDVKRRVGLLARLLTGLKSIWRPAMDRGAAQSE